MGIAFLIVGVLCWISKLDRVAHRWLWNITDLGFRYLKTERAAISLYRLAVNTTEISRSISHSGSEPRRSSDAYYRSIRTVISANAILTTPSIHPKDLATAPHSPRIGNTTICTRFSSAGPQRSTYGGSVRVARNSQEFLHLKWDEYIFGEAKEERAKIPSARSASDANSLG